MDSRQQFEEWVRARAERAPSGFYPQLLHRCTLDETRYVISWVDSAFEGWQASRESLVFDRVSDELYGINSNEIVRCVNDEWCDMLEEQGITWK